MEMKMMLSEEATTEPKMVAKASEAVHRPSVCLVIPAYNKSPSVELLSYRAIRSLFEFVDKTRVDLRIVVVDNNSPNKTDWGMMMLSLQDKFDVVRLKENRGFGPAVNLGAQVHKDSDYVAQMNTDCALVEDSVSILMKVLQEKGLDVAMPEHLENCEHYGMAKSEELMHEWFFGAFWIMTRKMWELSGGFDEEFKMCYFEDSSLWRTIESLGGKIAGWRGTWVSHIGGQSALPELHEIFEANRQLYEKKWKLG